MAEVDGKQQRGNPVIIEILTGNLAGQMFVYDQPCCVAVGRDPRAEINLAADRLVSLRHCRLEVDPPRCRLVDLGSHNGTLINGQSVAEQWLARGDVVKIGETLLRVRLDAATGRPDPAADPYAETQAVQTRPAPHALFPALPDYEIMRELGHGGMGAVYEARNRSSGQRVAVKLIAPAVEPTEQAVQFFLREAGILAQLKHKRIVRFHELGAAGRQLYLVMEYVETIDVRAHLLTRPEASRTAYYCGIICQVLDALGYAHRLGLVHRDIKPSNILVSRQGNRLATRVADFGLAKNFESAGFSGMTREGDRRGSLHFMSPEQLLDARHAKPAADIFSVGATLYSFLAGRCPHDFSQSEKPPEEIVLEPPRPLASVRGDLPGGLADLVDKAMSARPEDRFATAEEMYRALYPYAARRPSAGE